MNVSKTQTAKLSNADLAELTGYSIADVHLAFKKYANLVDAIGTAAERPGEMLSTVLVEAGFERMDLETAEGLVRIGQPGESLGEIAGAPGVGFATVRNLIPVLRDLDVPTFDMAPRSVGKMARRSSRALIDPNVQLAMVTNTALAVLGSTPKNLFLASFMDDIEELGEDLGKIGDAVDEVKDLVKTGKGIIKELKEAKDLLSEGGKSSTGAGVGTQTNPETPQEFNGELQEDEYARIFGEVIDSEPLYTAWIDRLMAFEVDGAGDDNVYMTVQSQVFLKNPDYTVSTSFVTNVYDIDELEEWRLKPKRPTDGKRARPLDPDDWKIRGFLEEKDAALALRVKGAVRGIPLSRLRRVSVTIYVYESDSVKELMAAVAAVGAAAVAALAIIKGKFKAPAGSTLEVTNAIERALNRLNDLINSDDKILYDQITFSPDQFRDAFQNGQTFTVRQRNATAACGMPYQRIVGGLTEDDEVVDTEEADAILDENKSKLKNEDFWEDTFDSYYEVRMRFERTEPDP